MQKRRFLSRCLAAGLAASCLLAGCGASEETVSRVVAGETISADSKWINSDIDGAINENTQVSLKDDFYTAVNRDWLLETELTEEKPQASWLSDADDLVRERKLSIIQSSGETPTENSVGLDGELLAHDVALVKRFAELAGVWDTRNELGVEPLRPYVEAIENIRSLEDMTAYLLNKGGKNFTQISLVGLTAGTSYSDSSEYVITVTPNRNFTLGSQDQYLSLGEDGALNKTITDGEVTYLLGRLGYDEKRIRKILTECYRFEGRMAYIMKDSMGQQTLDYLEKSDNSYTYEELTALCSRYPLKELLEAYGVAGHKKYIVHEPDYVKNVDKLYRESNLEEMKSYYLVHTLCEILPLLDRESFEKSEELKELYSSDTKKDSDPTGQQPKTEEDKQKDELDILFDSFIGQYLAGPMEQIYVARYTSKEIRDEILSVIDDTISYYRGMIRETSWLSEETREKAVDKLDDITVRAVYPEKFTDYRALNFSDYEGDGTLVTAVAAVKNFRMEQNLKKAGKAVDYNTWDLDSDPTTVVNAYYSVLENSITILAGILNGSLYDPEASLEEKMAGIGMIIGHEITHAFDSVGFQFDKNGMNTTWCTAADMSNFMIRASDVRNYFGAIAPHPAATLYNGGNVEAQDIADMGGLKCALEIGKQSPDFDIQKFFTAYAVHWRMKNSYEEEARLAETDVHPLHFLRVNVTVQQFEDFYEAFDIQPGDGMYLAPEKRIPVW